MRPTARQRELLHRLRGDGLPASALDPADRRLVDGLARRNWIALRWVDSGATRVIVTSRLGEAALLMPAPPPPWGRIGCINPMCGKTAAQEKHPGCDAIICVGCFKKVPDLKREYFALQARLRKVDRAWRRRGGGETSAFDILRDRIEENWRAIVAAFTAPEKPEGLDEFLKEMGWDERREHEEAAPAS